MGVHPKDAPDEVEYFTVTFSSGIPVEINGSPVTLLKALTEANRIGGRNGIGIGIHTVENRFVGIKSRGVYESPGMELLGRCYEYLLQLILDRRATRVFGQVSAVVAEQIYQGYWFDPATQSLLASIDPFTHLAQGVITVALYKGTVAFHAAGEAPHSLYSEETASMEAVGDFNHANSEGFVSVLGVGARALAVRWADHNAIVVRLVRTVMTEVLKFWTPSPAMVSLTLKVYERSVARYAKGIRLLVDR